MGDSLSHNIGEMGDSLSHNIGEMGGSLSHNIDEKSLERGDHIYCFRKMHIYTHHGIYVGDNRVIHFNRTEPGKLIKRKDCEICGYNSKKHRGVVQSCVKCFRKYHRLYRCDYGVTNEQFLARRAGTCSLYPSDDADVVIRRATKMQGGRIGNFGEYKFRENNCETFAVYCKTGQRLSYQYLSARQKLVNFIDNITAGKPFTWQNLNDAAVEVLFGYKLGEIVNHAILVALDLQKEKEKDYFSDYTNQGSI